MRAVSALVGLPIVVRARKLGRVSDVEFSDDLTHITGLYYDAGLRGKRFLDAGDIRMIGSLAVQADNEGVRKKKRDTPLFRRAVGYQSHRLYAVCGALFDEESLAVSALLLSRGILADLVSGPVRTEWFRVLGTRGEAIVKEEEDHEGNDQGNGGGRAAGRVGGDRVRHDELADGTALGRSGRLRG